MDQRIRKIADYLLGRREAAEVDPIALGPALLPHMFVLALEQAPGATPRLRIQLAGTALDIAFGRPLKARCMEDFLHGARSADVLRGFHDCAETRAPQWMRQVVSISGRLPRFVEGVAVHLAPDRIYGGLVVGDVTNHDPGAAFERRTLR